MRSHVRAVQEHHPAPAPGSVKQPRHAGHDRLARPQLTLHRADLLQALEAALHWAEALCAFPQTCLRGDRQSEDHFRRQRAGTILGRGADAQDVSAALVYLLDARAVTGQLICVDGGQHLA